MLWSFLQTLRKEHDFFPGSHSDSLFSDNENIPRSKPPLQLTIFLAVSFARGVTMQETFNLK